MNILVLGNGFDIAHGLPTKYEQFLKTMEIVEDLRKPESDRVGILEKLKNENLDLSEAIWQNACLNDIPTTLITTSKYNKNILKKDGESWEVNFWRKYFIDNFNGTWIDFEKNIEKVCTEIEQLIYNDGDIIDIGSELDINKELPKISKFIDDSKNIKSYAQLICMLENDLDTLIYLFNSYVFDYINKNECDKFIEEIMLLEIDGVISFNYSDTYERVYRPKKDIVSYVHGKAKNDRYKKLVLGYDTVDKNIPEEISHLNIYFKKYYQKVLNDTDKKYIKWITRIKENKKNMHNVYFVGHSMDITDKEIINGLILNENVNTIVYYYDDDDKKRKIKNLVRTLGAENFKNYTGSEKIKLIPQPRSTPIKYSPEYENKHIVKSLYDLPCISKPNYEKVELWIEKCSEKKYIYMAIDALQKNRVSLHEEWIEKLKKKVEDLTTQQYSLEQFKKDYLYHCTENTSNEDEDFLTFIEDIESKVAYDKKKREISILLQKIKVHNSTMNAILKNGPENYIDFNILKDIVEKFLKYVEESTSLSNEYDYMHVLLNSSKREYVLDVFNHFEKSSDPYTKFKVELLKNKYYNLSVKS